MPLSKTKPESQSLHHYDKGSAAAQQVAAYVNTDAAKLGVRLPLNCPCSLETCAPLGYPEPSWPLLDAWLLPMLALDGSQGVDCWLLVGQRPVGTWIAAGLTWWLASSYANKTGLDGNKLVGGLQEGRPFDGEPEVTGGDWHLARSS